MIEILLSTWNGEKYLEELLNSILTQTCDAWHLLIRDDGSHDGTISIIKKYFVKYPEKIQWLRDSSGNLGSTKSFEVLMRASRAEYIMFCDQDDVWLPEKVQKTYDLMKQTETSGCPAAVFTDLKVVDEKLNVLAESFERQQKMFPGAVKEKHQALALSVAAGCTIMLNRAALEKCLPVPGQLIHDHWCISIVSACGTVSYLDEPTVLYRQHGSNVIGTSEVNFRYYLKRILNPFKSLHAFCVLIHAFPYEISGWKVLGWKVRFAVRRVKIKIDNGR